MEAHSKHKNILTEMTCSLTISIIWTLSDDFLKTWRQRKKMLKTSNFYFCHHVFNSIQLLYFHLKVVSKCVRVCFSKSPAAKLPVCGKGLIHTYT